MDGGTTNLILARRIALECSNIQIVTNSIDIAYTFSRRKDISMYICGGTMGDDPGSTVVGPMAEKMITYFRANICFLGTLGIDLKKGITDPSLPAARMKSIMMENASKVILVTDSSKFGKINTAFVCTVDQFDVIITDRNAPKEDIEALQNEGQQVFVV
jgi:DeoR/GlpR family transcriptional regulator of sugar metabolism